MAVRRVAAATAATAALVAAWPALAFVEAHSGLCHGCTIYQYCRPGDTGCGNCGDVCESSKPDYNWELCKKECFDYLRDLSHVYGAFREHKDTIDKMYALSLFATILLVLVFLKDCVVVSQHVYAYAARKLKTLRRKNYKEKLSAAQYSITAANNNNNNNNSATPIGLREMESNGGGAGGGTRLTSDLRDKLPSTITLSCGGGGGGGGARHQSSPTNSNASGCTATTTATASAAASAVRILPLTTEEPTEDTTLDYASYYRDTGLDPAYVNYGMSPSQSQEMV